MNRYLNALKEAVDAVQLAYDECPNMDAYKLDIAQLEKAVADLSRMQREEEACERRDEEDSTSL